MILLIVFHSIILATTPCDIPFCAACTGGFCYQCEFPYQLYNGVCMGQSCLDRSCVTCDGDKFMCIECSPLYQNKNGVCKVATYVIVAPTIIFLLALSICLFYCLLRIHKKRLRMKAIQQLYQQQKASSQPPIPTSDHVLDNPNFHFQYQHEKGFCSICLEGQSNLITQCGHYFHVSCFSSWIRRHKICPILMLCMRCKKRYYHYQTFINFVHQVQVDMDRPCTNCDTHRPRSRSSRRSAEKADSPKIKIQQAMISEQIILHQRQSHPNQ